MAVRKKAIVTNAMEAVGESVEQPRRPVSSRHGPVHQTFGNLPVFGLRLFRPYIVIYGYLSGLSRPERW